MKKVENGNNKKCIKKSTKYCPNSSIYTYCYVAIIISEGVIR